ncbi:MAG: hypothetical protein OEY23_12080 [Acidimicrobiia bacterium]|nr:hypothetical protein [Acidimicrobiia bacterium]
MATQSAAIAGLALVLATSSAIDAVSAPTAGAVALGEVAESTHELLTLRDQAGSPVQLHYDEAAGVVVAQRLGRDGVAVEIDVRAGRGDVNHHGYGMTPIIDGVRFEGTKDGYPMARSYGMVSPASLGRQVTAILVSNEGGYLRVRFEGVDLAGGVPAEVPPLGVGPTLLDAGVSFDRIGGLAMDVTGDYRLYPTADATTIEVSDGAGALSESTSVEAAAGPFTRQHPMTSIATVRDGDYGPVTIQTATPAMLDTAWDGGSTQFELRVAAATGEALDAHLLIG